jgi:hypothetical protein
MKPDGTLMWSHYADGHRGSVLGVDVNGHEYDVRPIKSDGPARLQDLTGIEAAKEVLSHKLDAWSCEEEVRVFEPRKHHVDVEVSLVICGRKMSPEDKSLRHCLTKSLYEATESHVDLF